MNVCIRFTIVWCLILFISKPIKAQDGAQIVVHTNTLPESLAVEVIMGDKVFTAFGLEEDFGHAELRPVKLLFNVRHGVLNIDIPTIAHARNVSFGYLKSPVDRRTLNSVGLYDYMYLSPGDSVEVWENNGQITFRGKSAPKFKAFHIINSYRDSIRLISSLLMDSMSLTPSRVIASYKKLDHFTSLELKEVSEMKELRATDRVMLEAASVFINEQIKRTFWTFRGGDRVKDINTVYNGYTDPFWSSETILKYASSSVVSHSIFFLQRLRATYYYDSCYRKGKTLDIAGNYRFYSKYTTGNVLEWLTYRLVKENLNSDGGTGAIKYCIENALTNGIVRNNKAKEDFKTWLQTNVAGVKAFNFEVIDTKGRARHLSDYKGKVLLLDFWFIGCGNCIKIQSVLDSVLSKLKSKNFLLVSICLDDRATINEWQREVKRGVYTKDDHVNLFASTKEKNGAEIKEKLGVDYAPLLVLIDKDGNIAAKPSAPGWGHDPEFLLRTITPFL